MVLPPRILKIYHALQNIEFWLIRSIRMDTKRQNVPSLTDNVRKLHSDYTISIVYYQINLNSISHLQMN